jgi:hypothetical protein
MEMNVRVLHGVKRSKINLILILHAHTSEEVEGDKILGRKLIFHFATQKNVSLSVFHHC